MHKLPVVSGRDLIKFLKKLGYEIVRQRGSHIRLRKETEYGIHNITVPYHEEIAKGTLNAILNDVSKWNNIPKEELIKKLK
ncbi:YcfA family protein [Methanocaldococcus lauensis]|uniref:type II toxin-antitoxin system HicA family toxin n=1 Tax=Methanocaldococcus sp. TaxID=2152917 RepID=UPI001BED4E1D|nr:type II toxin-antitoxin system HicA family toxin [Methanocaldococcus sp.]MCQ6254041.1 type II toxin-antitoxin system HicA family toxin [Methanocaldococcus sp.]CAB3288042.1 YcfA family protein [Methanocaldococcus lauensis]